MVAGTTAGGIPLGVVCVDCAHSILGRRGEPSRVTQTTALSFISRKGLSGLAYAECRNPHYRSAAPMKMFLEVEVEVVRAAEERERARALEEQGRDAERRRAGLPFDAGRVPAPLCCEVLGDFLDPKRSRKFSRKRVIAAHAQVRKTVEAAALLGTDSLVPVHALAVKRPEYPDARALACGVRTVNSLLRHVVGVHACDIVGYMRDEDEAAARAALPGFGESIAQFKRMRGERLRTLARVAGVEHLLTATACAKRVARYRKYKRYEAEHVVRKLVEFEATRHDREARRALLQKAMSARGLRIRPDSSYCSDFIRGAVDVDPEEVAAVMLVTSELFDRGHVVWSNNREEAERRLDDAVFDKGMSWTEATAYALNFRLRRGRW